MADDQEYTSQEVMLITGMTYRQLDYTISSGLVTPSVAEGKGQGHPRLFAPADVSLMRVVTALREQGIQGTMLRNAVEAARTAGDNGYLVVPVHSAPFIVDAPEEAFAPDAFSWTVVNLEKAKVE